MSPRCQQEELYAAERRVDLGRPVAAEDLQDWVTNLMSEPWWHERFPRVRFIEANPLPDSRTGSVGTWYADTDAGHIEMAPIHLVENYLCHEIAHVCAESLYGSRSHDPYFARIYLELVFRLRGVEAWQALKAEFDNDGIVYDERID